MYIDGPSTYLREPNFSKEGGFVKDFLVEEPGGSDILIVDDLNVSVTNPNARPLAYDNNYDDWFLNSEVLSGDDEIDVDRLRGNIYMHGYRGADELTGGYGDDMIKGGNGADVLTGNDGADILYGGFGHNSFTGERDGQVDSLFFKSDQFAYNWIYESASNSPNGEKVDVIKALDANDQVFVQGVTTSELSFGSLSNFSTATENFSSVGIYANGFLEAIYAGGDLNASQLQAMTSGVPI